MYSVLGKGFESRGSSSHTECLNSSDLFITVRVLGRRRQSLARSCCQLKFLGCGKRTAADGLDYGWKEVRGTPARLRG